MSANTIGKWLFIAAIVLAILGAFVTLPATEWVATLVLLLAFAGAYLWIDKDEAKGWMITALALAAFAGALNGLVYIGGYLTTIFTAIAGIFGVAVIALVVKKIVGWFMK